MSCASDSAPASYLSRYSVKLVAAFAAVYVLWGGTYLGVRLGLETLPPFFLMAVRSVTAGVVLFAVASAWASPFPAWREWRAAAVVGVLFFVFSHGVLAYAQQRVPSGLAALVMATIPLWVQLISWVRPAGHPPSARAILTVSAGFAGVALLLEARQAPLTGAVEISYIAAVLFAAFSWAVGMVVSRELALPASHAQAAGMELFIGGALLFIISMTIGETAVLDLTAVSARSLAGLVYLILFGSLLGFSAYVFLLHASTPDRVATYAYVNPVVALVLGWAVLGEPVTATMLVAALIILTAVAGTITEVARNDASEQQARPRT